jgi:poly(A) polymerase
MKFFGAGRMGAAKDSPTSAKARTPAPHIVELKVIPREIHGISRKRISPNALRVLYRLHEAGFRACLVGGAVRDLLLGIEPKDFDVATSASPEQVKQLFRNCRLIGRRFMLAHVVYGREIIEVATFRGSLDDGSGDRHMVDGRIVRDNVWGTIEEDAIRRDFTVNALYYDIADFSVLDFVGGYDDVTQRRLRLIGDVDLRYREDPVRMLRAVRLAAKLEFQIEASAAAAIPRLAPLLNDAAPARLFEELIKLFMSGHASESFRALDVHGLLQVLFPPTYRALHATREVADRRLIEVALESTDRRIAEDKPVTPAFLLAALLWPAARVAQKEESEQGADPQLAWTRAASRVVGEQTARIALPKRFSIPMAEIWALQPRFDVRSKGRARRLLAHPRFRAAFDFLALRALGDPTLRESVLWWTQAQGVEPDDLVVEAIGEPVQGEEPLPERPRRRRRRRRGGRGGGAGSGGSPPPDGGAPAA